MFSFSSEMERVRYIEVMLKHPFTCLVAGATSSGKSFLVRKIIDDWKNVIHFSSAKKVLHVLWYYSEMQDLFKKPTNSSVKITYIQGLPNEDYISLSKPDLIIIDDLMVELANSKELVNLFTKKSHHWNVSIVFIVQNLYFKGKQMTTIARNSHYTILLSNRRDQSQIWSLARQLYPGKSKEFLSVYQEAVKRPYGYLLIDTRPGSNQKFQLRTRIFTQESPYKGIPSPIIYEIN